LPIVECRLGGDCRPVAADPPFKRVAVIGFGLVGGSVAAAAARRWPGIAIVPIDKGDPIARVAGADLVVLAAPVLQNRHLLEQLADALPGEALITDAGSTKKDIVHAARALPARLRFVGGHPLAGAATAGMHAARADLFAGRPWIFTPDETTRVDDIERLEAFVTALGALPQRMSAEAHDRLVAFLSHLPQLTASALMHVVGEAVGDDGLGLAGRGLVDTTRLASSPAEIWKDITATNADEIAEALDTLISLLQELRADLTDGDRLADVFESASRWRAALPK
jgi:prephenate dehydrogenase